jgi:hypothetical protein
MTNKERDAWILIRSHIEQKRKVSITIPVFNAVAILDRVFKTTKNNAGRGIEHNCDLRDFIDGTDICTACEQRK